VKMILDAQIVEKEMKWSEMCILCEFVKVSVFLNFDLNIVIFLKIVIKQKCKVVIYVVRNIMEMKGIEIEKFSVMKLSFLENEISK